MRRSRQCAKNSSQKMLSIPSLVNSIPDESRRPLLPDTKTKHLSSLRTLPPLPIHDGLSILSTLSSNSSPSSSTLCHSSSHVNYVNTVQSTSPPPLVSPPIKYQQIPHYTIHKHHEYPTIASRASCSHIKPNRYVKVEVGPLLSNISNMCKGSSTLPCRRHYV